MSTVVLLGAGASYGSIDAHPHTPPLGGYLFDELVKAGGVAATLPDELKATFRSDFEAGMAEYYEWSGRNIMRFQRELAQYLAQFRPGPNNVYVRMIREVGTTHVVYSSLNYDLLIEESARIVGLEGLLDGLLYSSNVPSRHMALLKLHGSSNFWPDIPLGTFKNIQIADSGRADVSAPIRTLTLEETLHRCANDDSFSPALAMYAKGKAVKVSPDFVENQQAQWQSAVKKAARVFVSGVRVVHEDGHIWDTLAKTGAKVTYFGSPSSKPGFDEWKIACGKKNLYFVEANFEQCIDIMKKR
ncbi:hypothetical protein [Burkholderia sp. Bp8986]|uniref:hypothetical protein n=1 Tax=Burkholderia sp. Bp8986 TaxID=2184550 RepID=UPI000F599CAD|nr:hypothetical protein [Burkholderia sp. Bp8986]RQS60400.1 hypothetical protein DID99_01770 [Burkholderia sp. Bp8986]